MRFMAAPPELMTYLAPSPAGVKSYTQIHFEQRWRLSMDVAFRNHAGLVLVLALVTACSRDNAPATTTPTATAPVTAKSSPVVPSNPMRDVYFGNFHVHTMYSFDAITVGCVTDPDAAFRWAKGEAIPGGGGGPDHKIKKPLDWYTVSDHAEYLGVFSKMTDSSSPLSQLEIAKRVTS